MEKSKFKSLYNKLIFKNKINNLYKNNDYLDAYSKHTDYRVDNDPKDAIGGKWDEIGQLQFDFLKNEGLIPNHKMLDIGCGTLRGGQHFIKYLKTGNYYGIDISEKAVEYANDFIINEGLSDKNPSIILNENKDLRFKDFDTLKFDFILAQSVFTHLQPQHIEECFANVMNIMHSKTTFFFTYFKADNYNQRNIKDFEYPFSFFEKLADQYGYIIDDLSNHYHHPRGQQMLSLKLK